LRRLPSSALSTVISPSWFTGVISTRSAHVRRSGQRRAAQRLQPGAAAVAVLEHRAPVEQAGAQVQRALVVEHRGVAHVEAACRRRTPRTTASPAR
jgi:hypothetical protein